MAKMTDEEKKAKLAAKKAEAKAKKEAKRAKAKAKKEAKRAALLEKKQKRAAAKKAKREAKRAKMLAKREKERAKKAKLREKKRLAREKKRAVEAAKKLKMKSQLKKDGIDLRTAAKDMKLALAQIADEMSKYDTEARAKKAKAIYGMGYDVEYVDGKVIARFYIEKSKKSKAAEASQPKENAKAIEKKGLVVDSLLDTTGNGTDDTKDKVELVPAGDLYGTNGVVEGEVANLEDEDCTDGNDDAGNADGYDGTDDEDSAQDDDIFSVDSRDEQDQDIIDNRREFFNTYGEDFEVND